MSEIIKLRALVACRLAGRGFRARSEKTQPIVGNFPGRFSGVEYARATFRKVGERSLHGIASHPSCCRRVASLACIGVGLVSDSL